MSKGNKFASESEELPAALFEEFRIEASQNLDEAEKALLGLSSHPATALDEIFRAIHTLKGSASYLGFVHIRDVAHAFENILAKHRDGQTTSFSEAAVDLFFSSVDLLRKLVDADDPEELASPVLQHVKLLESEYAGLSQSAAPPASAPVPEASPVKVGNDVFSDVACQQLMGLDHAMSCLLENGTDEKALKIFNRSVSTIRSAADYMGFNDLVEIADRIKILIKEIPSDGFSALSLPLLLGEYILLKDRIAQLGQPSPATEAFTEGEDEAADSWSVLEIPPTTPQMVQEQEAVSPEILSHPDLQALSEPAELSSLAEGKSEYDGDPLPAKTAKGQNRIMRVDQEHIDRFINLVGELIIAKNSLEHLQTAASSGGTEHLDLRELKTTGARIAHISGEMQNVLRKVRLMPIGHIFDRCPRIVRDLMRQTGKRVQLLIEGEETEIDKKIADELVEPLVHLVRNAVDHGLEPEDERLRLGKSRDGAVALKAGYGNNCLLLEVSDDGRGINLEAVRHKAVEKKVISAEQAETLSEDEILQLIFSPGLSTARTVTEVSGRGVGMDAVLTAVKRMNGKISVNSRPNEGACFTIQLPLTMAVMEALLVGTGANTYALPVASVLELVKLSRSEIKPFFSKQVISLRGEVLSAVELGRVMHHDHPHGKAIDKSERVSVLILQSGPEKLALMVDQIHRKEEIVVKPLPENLVDQPVVSGASVLGDGRAILILDVESIGRMASGALPSAVA